MAEMAEAAISLLASTVAERLSIAISQEMALADRLSKALIQEAAVLSEVESQVEWIERELRLMQAFFEHLACHGKVEEGVIKWVEGMNEVARDAEDAIESFVKNSVNGRMGILSLKDPCSLMDRYSIGKELEKISQRMRDISQRRMDYEKMNIPADVESCAGTSASSTTTPNAVVTPVVEKLSSILNQNLVTDREVKKIVEEVRDELVVMQNVVSNLEPTNERAEVWLEEVKEVCNFAVNVVEDYITRRERWLGMGRLMRVMIILFPIFDVYDPERKLKEEMKYIRAQIGDAHARRLTYGVGEEDVGDRIGSRSRLSQVDLLSRMDFFVFIPFWMMPMLKSMDKNFVSIQRDLALMHAFFRDTKCAVDKDKRQSVWIDQIGVVAQHGQALLTAYDLSMDRYTNAGVLRKLFLYAVLLPKFAEASNSMLDKMDCISERKTTYGIANIRGRTDLAFSGQSMQGSGNGIEILTNVEHNVNSGTLEEPLLQTGSLQHMNHEFWLVKELKEKVESMRGEMQLMNALFKDIEEMGELDRRSKIWVDQMRGISDEIDSVIKDYESKFEDKPMHNQILGYLTRIHIIKKIDEINTEIQDAWRRKKTYGLVKLRTLQESPLTRQRQSQRVQPWTLDTINMNLPLYLRRCLFYFTLFPAEFKIPKRRLVALWVAEGLVHQGEDNEPPEHVAERYLTELIDLGMVQTVKGKPKVKITKDLQEILLKIANESKSVPGHTDPGMASGSVPTNSIIRHVADHLDPDDICYNHIHGDTQIASVSLRSYYKDVLSFLSFDTQEGSKSGQDIGNFLNLCIASGCFLQLRVLDLEHVYKPQLPENIGRLSRLRYLGLRWTYLESLPSSISSLLKLQTLDLKHTYINTLTRSIWKMQLRHLFLSETYRTRFPPPAKRNSLYDLQTLWGLFIDEESPVKDGLDKLVNIRKLGLACQSMSLQKEAMTSQLEAVADWLLKLRQLQSLRLKSRDEKGQPWNLCLKSLENHKNLTNMYLLGILSTSSILCQFPPSLIELTLSHSRLQKDPMEILGKLPNLLSLSLLAESYMGESLLCNSGSFPQLQVLKFWKLEQLKQLKIEQEALPCLTKLEFRLCESLNMLPDGLQHVRTLHELKLTKMPTQLKIRIRDNSEDQHKIAHIPNIICDAP